MIEANRAQVHAAEVCPPRRTGGSVRQRCVAPDRELHEFLRRGELVTLTGLDSAGLARHARQKDWNPRASKRLEMLRYRPRADSLSRRRGLRAYELDSIARDENLHLMSFVHSRPRHEQP